MRKIILENVPPIWRLFWTLVFITLIFSLALSRYFYNEVLENKFENLKHLNTLIKEGWVESRLFSEESIMKLLSDRLQEVDILDKSNSSEHLIKSILNNHPYLLGIGIAKPDGKLISISGKYIENLPNLLDDNTTAPTFQETLEKDHLVLGTTYRMKFFDKWVLPLRYAVRDKNGVKMVLVFWYDIESGNALFSYKNIPDDITVNVISDKFFVLDYKLNSRRNLLFYGFKLPERVVNQFDLRKLKNNEIIQKPYLDKDGITRYVVVSYIQKYSLFITTSRGQADAISGFQPILIKLIFGTLFFIFVLYLFFYFVATKDKEIKEKLEYRANHDEMTGLMSRFALNEKMEALIYEKTPFCLAFIDLDNFNKINDLYGHELGDLVIQKISKRLSLLIKDDTYLARFSGDEFALVSQISAKKSSHIYKNILHTIKQPLDFEYNSIQISASMGIAVYPDDTLSVKELMSFADIAQHQAKIHKDSFTFFDVAFHKNIHRKSTIEALFNESLENKEFYVAYQPQVDANSHEIVGAEALARWKSSKLGDIYPDEFIPIAEETGFIIPLGLYILELSCKETLQTWKKCGKEYSLSVNVSVRQLVEENFIKKVFQVLDKLQFPYHKLIIEVTESIMIEDSDIIIQKLRLLRDKNIGVSLDDFGTGFSSLSMINKLPITEIKIDQSFVKDILVNTNNAILTEMIVDIGKHLKINIVAEGIEEQEHVTRLGNFGCNILQGYHFLRPTSTENLLAFIKDNIICFPNKHT